MTTHHYIACDLGAESGRVILGTLEDRKLTVEEIHRFPNGPVVIQGSLHWDVQRLFAELKTGLQKVAARNISVSSLSCDSWGVDYVLLGSDGRVLTPPFHYRDARSESAMARAFAIVSSDKIFAETGVQLMAINTLYQLLSDFWHRPAVLNAADHFLNMGDYFNFLLSGVARGEESLVSTSQVFNPHQRRWSRKLIEQFGLPEKIFPEIVEPGKVLGRLQPGIAGETGLNNVKVVASCSHDTGAAVAAVPGDGDSWAYLSSGTWSLLGVEIPRPIINSKSMEYHFTNEVGYGSKILFLKNIIGLWIVQECRNAWKNAGKEYEYDELSTMAEMSEPLKALIDPTDERFAKPDNMPEKIADYCRETGQPIPVTPGESVRCVIESLARLYRQTIGQLEDVIGKKVETLHIVGGGSKNRLLNQLTADCTCRTVFAGPVECTAIGNVLIQAIALGHVASISDARKVVRDSFPLVRYEPKETMTWDNANKKRQTTHYGVTH